MSIEDRLRNAAHAVDEMWADNKTTQDRLARLEARLSTQAEVAMSSSPRTDAVQLIADSELALERAVAGKATLEIVAETGQAMALTSAIGSHLTEHGPPGLADTAIRLAEFGYPVLDLLEPTTPARLRADQLGEIPDVYEALQNLGALLSNVAIALVGVACDADDEALYGQCLDAMDTTDDMIDQVYKLLRSLMTNERRITPAAQPRE